MPELPDILLYVSALERQLLGQELRRVSVRGPALLKTYRPDLNECVGLKLTQFSRVGKRLVWHFDERYFLVFHLMIAGRFHWKKKPALPKSKRDLAAFQFDSGTMMLTEASQKKRAGLWCFDDVEAVRKMHSGGVDVLSSDNATLKDVLLRENNTLKRALADPSRFDGIGNAYSDEILHAAQLSPLKRTKQLNASELDRLCDAIRTTLATWIQRLQTQHPHAFPERVTAFRPEMSVHGKYAQPCPVCGAPVQRIRYAENECNYCPGCQTEGRLLGDRSLSRLLKDDWPKSLDELDW